MLVFGNPWILLAAAAAVPALVAFHLYRRRFQPREVAGLFLWRASPDLPPAGRTRSRLDRPLSLLLEILAVLLLAALLAGARWETRDEAPHVVAILDHSASMAARLPSGESFADRARRRLREACEEEGPIEAVRLTAILSGPRPAIAAGPAAPAAEGLRALEAWKPLLGAHSFGPAIELARRLTEGGGRILVLTDHPDRVPAVPGARILGVGRPVANTALVGADRVREADGATAVAVRLAHFAPAAAERTVVLSDEAGAPLGRETVRLEPGGEAEVLWKVPPGHPVVAVRLEGADALEADDAAWLVEPRPPEVRVRIDFPDGSPERGAVERALRAVAGTLQVGEGDAELVVGPPQGEAAPWRLEIGAPPEAWRVGAKLDPLVGPYFADPVHPLMEDLDFRGVVWSGAWPMAEEARGRPLLTAGEVALLLERPGPSWLLNIDLSRSNCPKSPAWPLLFHNLAALRRDAMPGLRRWNFRCGETVTWRLAPGDAGDGLAVRGPDGAEAAPARARGAMELFDVQRPGLYRILKGRSETLDVFAVNFLDARESDLRGAHDAAPEPAAGGMAATVEARARRPWLETLLCLGVLALLLADRAVLRADAARRGA